MEMFVRDHVLERNRWNLNIKEGYDVRFKQEQTAWSR